MPDTISVPIPVSTLRNVVGDAEVEAALAYGRECLARDETDEVGAAQRVGGYLSVAVLRVLGLHLELRDVTRDALARARALQDTVARAVERAS